MVVVVLGEAKVPPRRRRPWWVGVFIIVACWWWLDIAAATGAAAFVVMPPPMPMPRQRWWTTRYTPAINTSAVFMTTTTTTKTTTCFLFRANPRRPLNDQRLFPLLLGEASAHQHKEEDSSFSLDESLFEHDDAHNNPIHNEIMIKKEELQEEEEEEYRLMNQDGRMILSDNDYFLSQVETTMRRVLQQQNHGDNKNNINNNNIQNLAPHQREAVGIARHLQDRLHNLRKNNDCPACWMQRAHCICAQTPTIVKPLVFSTTKTTTTNSNYDNPIAAITATTTTTNVSIHRIFVLMHHKEIGLKVDTAKLIFSTFGASGCCRLVVAGIGAEYQDSMHEMEQALTSSLSSNKIQANGTADHTHNHNHHQHECLVLFPDDHALTFEEILQKHTKQHQVHKNVQSSFHNKNHHHHHHESTISLSFDIVVLDGTWAQARKMFARYLQPPTSSSSSSLHNQNGGGGGPQCVHLGPLAVQSLQQQQQPRQSDNNHDEITNELVGETTSASGGHQLRRHVIPWRQVGTFEALRLFLEDILQATIMANGTQKVNDVAVSSNRGAGQEESLSPPQILEMATMLRDIRAYQDIANQAALRELGPPRPKKQKITTTT